MPFAVGKEKSWRMLPFVQRTAVLQGLRGFSLNIHSAPASLAPDRCSVRALCAGCGCGGKDRRGRKPKGSVSLYSGRELQ